MKLLERRFLIILLLNFMLGFILILPIKQMYYQEIGINAADIGLILLVYQITKLIFELPTGYVSDYIGRKTCVLFGFFLIFLGILLIYQDAYLYKLVSSTLLAIGMSFITGALDAINYNVIKSCTNKHVMKYSNILNYSEVISVALAYTLAPYLFDHDYFAGIYYESLLIVLCGFMILLFFKVDEANHEGEEQGHYNVKNEIKLIIKNKNLMSIYISAHTFTMVDIPFYAYTLIILTNKGLSLSVAGIVFGISLALKPITGSLVLKLNLSKRTQIFLLKYSAIGAIGFILLAITVENLVVIVLCIFLSRITFALVAPLRYAVKQDLIEEDYRAFSLSFESMFMSLLSVISYMIIASNKDIEVAIIFISIMAIIICFFNARMLMKDIKVDI